MSDARAPTLIEALAIMSRRDGHPSKALAGIIYAAQEVVNDAAMEAIARITNGLCPTCWGDGFHRTSPFMLSGACHDCNGTGRRTPAGDALALRGASTETEGL